MSSRISVADAKRVLTDAIERAQSERELPIEWENHARMVFGLAAKTYTPALGALLLAKATDENVDTLSIKVTSDPRSYSLRTVGHEVLVKEATRSGFALRTAGAEPLNNQPFFRYDHMAAIDRVKNPAQFRRFLAVASRADALRADEALDALAAFLRVAFEMRESSRKARAIPSDVSHESFRLAVEDFVRMEASDRPRRLQAIVASCLSLTHVEVQTRRINDPSRDLPGDVHAWAGGEAVLAVEVRGKPVSTSELSRYVDRVAEAGISRAALVVDAVQHIPIEVGELDSYPLRTGQVQLLLFQDIAEFVESALGWCNRSLQAAVVDLAEELPRRLREIEADVSTLDEWYRTVALLSKR